jgi:radical SAM superfamily enzyme YgiQ (UPF0313 family)
MAELVLANAYRLSQDRRERRLMRPYPPLGPLYIAAYVKSRGRSVAFHDCTFTSDNSGFEALLDREKPRLVGVYSTMLARDNARTLASIAKARGISAVAGGPDPACAPGEYLPPFDLVCTGEGEELVAELLEKWEGKSQELAGFQGIAYLKDGAVARTSPRPRIAELDALPFPARELADIDGYAARWRKAHGYTSTGVICSRGCPFDCAWCSKPVFGRTLRRRSVDNVMAELREIAGKYRVERVRFADDVLTLDKKWMMGLCARLEEEHPGLDFECLSRTDTVDPEMLRAMARAGFKLVYYGVESGSQAVLDSMTKGADLGRTRSAAAATRRAGIAQHWFLMLGYPGESARDVGATLDLLAEGEPEEFSFTVTYPLEGTRFYDEIGGRPGGADRHWRSSRENRVLYKAPYPQSFYKAAIGKAHLERLLRRLGRTVPPARALEAAFRRATDRVLGLAREGA